jgi:type I restriction enzyme S subunit
MAGEWRSVPFGQAVEINPLVPLFPGHVYPFVDMKSLEPSYRSVGPSVYREFQGGGSRFKSGDILMARITPCLENGKIARFRGLEDQPLGHGSTEFIVIRGKDGITDTDFAYYMTRSALVREYAISQMTGSSGRQRVPVEALANHRVFLPPLPEQRAIAHILGMLDDKIELNRQMNETLEEIARAIFKSWFVDFNPIIDNALRGGNRIPSGLAEKAARRRELLSRTSTEGRNSSFPKHISDLFADRFVDSQLGHIPAGWGVGTIGDFAEHPRRGVRPEELVTSTPYIALEHMPKHCIALSEWGVADAIESNKFEFKRGEILFGKLRPYFHKVGVAPVDGVCSTDIVVIAPKAECWFGFVLAHVSSDAFVEHSNAGSIGTKMPRTSWTDMARYRVVIPPVALAAEFNSFVFPAVERIFASIRESHTLAALRDTLLPKLISGELPLKNVNEFITK